VCGIAVIKWRMCVVCVPPKRYTVFQPQSSEMVYIICIVNCKLLLKLEVESKLDPGEQMLGKIFLDVSMELMSYSVYCGNHPFMTLLLIQLKTQNPEFIKFLNEVKLNQKERTRNLDIGDFLIKPLQRICKYPLLIKEMLKFIDESHDDYSNLMESGVFVEMTLNDINARMLESEYEATKKRNISVK